MVELAAGRGVRSHDGVVWIDVLAGRMALGTPEEGHEAGAGEQFVLTGGGWACALSPARFAAHSTRRLLGSGELWDRLDRLQAPLLRWVDAVIGQRERDAEARLLDSAETGRKAADTADRTLRAVLDPQEHAGRTGPGVQESAVEAACRLVAEEMGIGVAPCRGTPAGARVGPVEAFATRFRFRVREVKLPDRWWRTNAGPFLGYRSDPLSPFALVWRRGRYQAWNPVTGERTPVTRESATGFEPHGVVFYTPLPDRPLSGWRLIRFGLRGSGVDLRRLLVCTLVAVGLGALVPSSVGVVLGTLVPRAESGLIVQLCIALLVAAVTSAAFAALENLALLRVEGRFEATLQAAVWDRLLRLPAPFFKKYSTGELASVALGVKNIRSVVTGVGYVLLYSTAVAVVNLAVMFWVSVPLALLASGYVLAGLGLFALLAARQMPWQARALEIQHRLANRVYQMLRGLPKLRVAAAEERAFAVWAEEFARQKILHRRIGRYQRTGSPSSTAATC